jgi:hypothetical protein
MSSVAALSDHDWRRNRAKKRPIVGRIWPLQRKVCTTKSNPLRKALLNFGPRPKPLSAGYFVGAPVWDSRHAAYQAATECNKNQINTDIDKNFGKFFNFSNNRN